MLRNISTQPQQNSADRAEMGAALKLNHAMDTVHVRLRYVVVFSQEIAAEQG